MARSELSTRFGHQDAPVIASLKQHLTEKQGKVLGHTVWLSGRTVRIAKENGKVRLALDIPDTLPDDFAPALVLDASGRVRGTYTGGVHS
jgi:alpha-galactosidase